MASGMLLGLGILPIAICVVVIGLGVLLYVVMTYNRLITLRNRVENAWAQIDVQLKRRYDLIPNLVETVKGYAKHEKETFENVTKYRAQIVTGSVEERAQANNMLSQALKSLFAVAENYPQLKANENFKMLQEELAGTENKVAYIRTAYNDSVLEYGNALQMFPSNILANMFGFKPKAYFEAPAAERENVKVKF
ncbi:MAG: LemA family protein [Candidatus Micrarchaeia archaeon]